MVYAFFISSPRHHADTIEPVVSLLTSRGQRCRIISLCELRGFATPVERFAALGAEVVRVFPGGVRSSPLTGGRLAGGGSSLRGRLRGLARNGLRRGIWHGVLSWRIASALRDTALAVLPNDAAYPYDHIAATLRVRSIPFVLVQEGIRFPLPGSDTQHAYGCGGAAVIAAWGEGSATYFAAQGVPAARIELAGNPRLDQLLTRDWDGDAAALRHQLGTDRPIAALLTNPIDDQGFCSAAEKMSLVHDVLRAMREPLRERDMALVIKLHPREDEAAYRAAVVAAGLEDRATVLRDAPLYPLLRACECAAVMASTAGLEALLFDAALAVLELPRGGFAFDYVERSAAMPLRSASLDRDVAAWLGADTRTRDAVADYVDYHLASRGSSAQVIASLLDREARVG